MKFSGFFSPFLIPAASADANQHLSAALAGMMNVPVVPASGFKRHIKDRNLLRRKRSKVTLSDEILHIRIILMANRENRQIGRNTIQFTFLIAIDFLNQRERAPRLWPSAIERQLGHKFNRFLLRHAMFPAHRQMRLQLRIQSCRKQRSNGNHAPVTRGKFLFP